MGDKYVITAAHCTEWVSAAHYIEWVRPEDLKVQIGETVLYNFNEAHSAPFRVASIIRHPNFTYIDNIPRYDIAVLKLTKRVPLYKYPNIKPACLPNQGALFHGDAIVTGWGRLNFHGHFATSLREVGVTVFDDKKCRIGTEDTICAGHRGGGRDACGGDSGGPHEVTANAKNAKSPRHLLVDKKEISPRSRSHVFLGEKIQIRSDLDLSEKIFSLRGR